MRSIFRALFGCGLWMNGRISSRRRTGQACGGNPIAVAGKTEGVLKTKADGADGKAGRLQRNLLLRPDGCGGTERTETKD